MKHKTAELEGKLLDAAVAKADGLTLRLLAEPGRIAFWQAKGDRMVPWCSLPAYSSDWRYGGPLIERERIMVSSHWGIGEWAAYIGDDHESGLYHPDATGPAPLVAAMRAYVASRLGEELELP